MKKQHHETALSDIAHRLKVLRLKKGFNNIEEFCQYFDLPPMQYSKMETGRGTITLTGLLRVLSVHEISLEDFFCLDFRKAAA